MMTGYYIGPDPGDHARMVAAAKAEQEDPELVREKERLYTMGVALWCDPGDHAFKGGTPGSQAFRGTEVNEKGEEVNVQMNVCPDHTFRPFPTDATQTPELQEKGS